MKIKSFLLGLTYAIILYVVLPTIFIFLNYRFSLPVITFNYLKISGLVLVVFGAIFFVYLVRLFNYTGKGTPVPIEPPTKLIIKGPYKYVRNPMYLNHLLMFFAIFLVFGHFANFVRVFGLVRIKSPISKMGRTSIKEKVSR